ncbi:putative flippase GtrA [Luteibacter sp. PvP120]
MTEHTIKAPLHRRLRDLMKSQFVLFLIVGGSAAVVNFLSRVVINHWTSYAWSVGLAYVIGMTTAFVLNRLFVFKGSSQAVHHQALWFILVNLFALVQTLIVSVVLAKYGFPAIGFTWHPEAVAHAIGIMLPLVSSYFGHKYLSFRN